MANTPYVHSPSDEALRNFLITFGKEQEVKKEVVEYLKSEGELKAPTEIYAHLIDKRVKSGEFDAHRAGVLRAMFNDTFTPEPGTGYFAKHRGPLVEAMAQLYADGVKPVTPVWEIKGDISNLGGLNIALTTAALKLEREDKKAFGELLVKYEIKPGKEAPEKLGRAMADHVLRAICYLTKEQLERVANLIAVRDGGDEISFHGTPKQGVSEKDFQNAEKKIMQNVAQFVKSAGLKEIPHHKDPLVRERSGVGIGLHEIDMRFINPDARTEVLEEGIKRSKERFQNELHRDSSKIQLIAPVNLHKLEATLDVLPPVYEIHTVVPNVNGVGDSEILDRQRRHNLEGIIKQAGNTPITPAEEEAAIRTHAIMRKEDPVTGLPMFENMQAEQLPHFVSKYGKVKLINVDFSNAGGGNKLSPEIGDAMIQTFSNTLQVAMKRADMFEYYEGIAIRPGGKFAILVPADIPEKNLEKLRFNLRSCLDELSRKPLPVSEATIKAVREKIAETPKLQELYCPKGERLFDQNGQIPVANIISPKHQMGGSTVVMVASRENVDPQQPLEDQMRPLEKKAEDAQKNIFRERVLNGDIISLSKAAAISADDSTPHR